VVPDDVRLDRRKLYNADYMVVCVIIGERFSNDSRCLCRPTIVFCSSFDLHGFKIVCLRFLVST
jgi:hypothetical protein